MHRRREKAQQQDQQQYHKHWWRTKESHWTRHDSCTVPLPPSLWSCLSIEPRWIVFKFAFVVDCSVICPIWFRFPTNGMGSTMYFWRLRLAFARDWIHSIIVVKLRLILAEGQLMTKLVFFPNAGMLSVYVLLLFLCVLGHTKSSL